MANTKTLFSLLAVAAVGGFAYVFFKNQCSTAAGAQSYPMVCGWLGGSAGAIAAQPSTTAAPAPAASTPPPIPATAWPIAIAGMKAAAAGDSEPFDVWSYYFQNAPPVPGAPTGYGQSGSISPNLFGAIVQLGGGDSTKKISAEDFIGFYQAALKNAGLSGFEIPVWMIHRGAYS